ncbi:hypothetical protein [Nannocystis sp.]|uniref:hypothetical protein n=1 Tax=Nannocystis sp. TaxID=1962667 RepID=UPI0025ED4A46|nr:hypothetical protein [Nannocystis sp.]MBK7825695.1 hypothetical protein [Nannocystis sp.]
MSSKAVLDRIVDDFQSAAPGRGVIVYLEGKTDPPVLLALLGAIDADETANGVLHDGVLIRSLGGSEEVEQRIEVARKAGVVGVFGVLDGDGRGLNEVAMQFDAPYPGPQFRWKGYCIENLLARAGWPPAWGVEPDWRAEMASYAPYVALNRLGSELRGRMKRLDLDGYLRPDRSRPLRQPEEFTEMFRDGKHELANLDVDAMFSKEYAAVGHTIEQSLDGAHTLIDGKWLINDLAPRRTGFSQERCREDWTVHVRAAGGDPEICAWWRRAVAPYRTG